MDQTGDSAKKVIIAVVVVVVVVAVVGYLVWSGYKSPKIPPGVQTPQGTVVAPGTSPIATSGQVIAPTGAPAKLNAPPGTPSAPQQSAPIVPQSLPPSAVKLTVTAAGFSPSNFTVNSGAVVALSLTSGDAQTHIFYFDDTSLSAVAIGVGPGETRAIVFNAPKAGTYTFYCGVPGHKTRGEVGKMIVE